MSTRTFILVFAVAAQGAGAQSLENRIANARGTVAFEVNTRRNVCGNGVSITVSDDSTAGWTTRSRKSGMHIGRQFAGDSYLCEEAPARVQLVHQGATVTDVSVTVGGRAARADTELGAISAPEASRYLLSIAPVLASHAADQAVMGAAIVDAPSPWRRMLEIARANDASDGARKASLFWVSHEASTVATAGLTDVAMDDASGNSVRSDALFYLAQRKDGEGIPSLIRVVRESKSVKLKKDAIFFLSQSHDPRALDLFEKLLAGR
ncbi:MAG: hypothetical protein ABI625_13750 [bacterium]